MDASEPESSSKDSSNGTGNGNGSAEFGGDFAKNLKRGDPSVWEYQDVMNDPERKS